MPGEPLPLESGEEAWCRSRFAIQPEHTIAAAAAIDQGVQHGALVVRPVHLHAGLDHVVLDPPLNLELSDADARALFEAAVDWLAPEPIRLRYLSASLWELTESDPQPLAFRRFVAPARPAQAGATSTSGSPAGRPLETGDA